MTTEPDYALSFLADVRWQGISIPGERTRELLAILALRGDRLATDAELIDSIWPDERPSHPSKALQVVVSRARAATHPDVIVRSAGGYRLGLDATNVDVLAAAVLIARARAALDRGDTLTASDAAARAIDLTAPAHMSPGSTAGRVLAVTALDDLRRAAEQHYRVARRLSGMALCGNGSHEAALDPLGAVVDDNPADEAALAALLRSEASVRGAATALARFERHRRWLAETTGADPSEELQRIHAQLLAADHPIRDGIKFDATALLGRDDDVRRLRAILARSRIVSVIGPGGLGKTRLAHVIGRDADVAAVHFIELVGVIAPEDIIGELGSNLGVRNAVTTSRRLTPEQRSDLRSRIAGQLDRVPTLLIVDNCEHLVGAVADLVAFLVASTRDLTVLTTSRTPLNVAGERVYALGQLGPDHAAELLRQRVAAIRPDAALPADAVREVVARLDGLPLAIELAAAKVRLMSVADVAARLENRFSLLRGGDRSAPDRHQTLLAVIDWSWNLLTEQARGALRWLSVFHDGFTLAAAESMLGDGALAAIEDLADQSLVTVQETPAGIRYGMLETVREFGRMQLTGAGEEADALAAQTAWARDYATDAALVTARPDQLAVLDLLRAEEANLADVVRRALGVPDPDTVVVLLAALVGFWTVRGEHERLATLADAVNEAMEGYVPPAGLADATRVAMAGFAAVSFFLGRDSTAHVWRLLRALGLDTADPRVAAIVTMPLAMDPSRTAGQPQLTELSHDRRPEVATNAMMVQAHERENSGDPAAAIDIMERALAQSPTNVGPWLPAVLQGHLAQLNGQLGRYRQSGEHARQALPILERLGAADDLVSLRALLALAAVTDGRPADVQQHLDDIRELLESRSPLVPGTFFLPPIVAEIELAQGKLQEGLASYRLAVETARSTHLPGPSSATGLEPWTLYGGAGALAAHALYAAGDDGADLYEWLAAVIGPSLTTGSRRSGGVADIDYPVTGGTLCALALWGLARDAIPVDDALWCAALADRFGYNRLLPSLGWQHVADRAEQIAPGRLEAISEKLGDRRGAVLIADAKEIVIPIFSHYHGEAAKV